MVAHPDRSARPHSYLAPLATYRVQVNAGFGFAAARAVIAYLHDLGITDLYTSPLLAARPGSAHGYDVIDPDRLNGELGSREQFDALLAELHQRHMGLLLDIVPNHMAIGPENRHWMDVLAHGAGSPWQAWFDIAWEPPGQPGALEAGLLLPVLGATLAEVLDAGDLRLVLSDENSLEFHYFDEWRFPVQAGSWFDLLRTAAEGGEEAGARDALLALAERSERLPAIRETPVEAHAARRAAADELTADLQRALSEQPAAREAVLRVLRDIESAQPGESLRRLRDAILARQFYRLIHWRRAMRRLTYRRFFDITHLIGVRVEDPDVFYATHGLILELVRRRAVTGLRIDHIDGLADPQQYLVQLQAAIEGGGTVAAEERGPRGEGFYVLVEKILEGDEAMDESWPVSGTTGYDFLNALNGVFVDREGFERLAGHHAQITGVAGDFQQMVFALKSRVARDLFGGEVEALVNELLELAPPAVDASDLAEALIALSAALPVYRTYGRAPQTRSVAFGGDPNRSRSRLGTPVPCDGCFSRRDRDVIERAFAAARGFAESASREAGGREVGGAISSTQGPHGQDVRATGTAAPPAPAVPAKAGPGAMAFLRDVLLGDPVDDEEGEDRRRRFIVHWQQFTGPLMAKGLEDTALYRDARLISLNTVGLDPKRMDDPGGVVEFHRHNRQRRAKWPHTMNATSTHDTKRSEDVRARIHVLSEMPDRWLAAAERWMQLNAPHRSDIRGGPAPEAVMELFLYQTLLGVWPLEPAEEPGVVERVQQYAIKAAREAKARSDWLNPNEEYENALTMFISAILGREGARRRETAPFMDEFRSLQRDIAWHGALNALSRTVLKIAAPGVPDFYQGTELWDFSLVDPDNRRPVDYDQRRRWLAEMPAPDPAAAAALLESWRDGRIKQYITHRALLARRDDPQLFLDGEYVPVTANGQRPERLCALARHYEGRWAVAAAAVRSVSLCRPGAPPTGRAVWDETVLPLPEHAPQRWRNAFTGEQIRATGDRLAVADLFAVLPVCLLIGQ